MRRESHGRLRGKGPTPRMTGPFGSTSRAASPHCDNPVLFPNVAMSGGIVGSGGALPPFPTPTKPTISYSIFRLTLFMSPRASSALRSERRMLKGRDRPGRAKAKNIAKKEISYQCRTFALRRQRSHVRIVWVRQYILMFCNGIYAPGLKLQLCVIRVSKRLWWKSSPIAPASFGSHTAPSCWCTKILFDTLFCTFGTN